MRTVSTGLALSLAVVLVGFLSACDDKSPTAPQSTAPPTTPTPTLTRLEIVGPRTVPPGETAQFAVRGVLSDGSTQDLTGQASWQSQSSTVLSVDASGRASSGQRGATLLTAAVAPRSVSTEVMVVSGRDLQIVGCRQ